VLAIFGDFAFTELLLVAAVALMVFGKRLPEVAVRAAAHLTRLRRSLTQMWREAGIEDELRKVRREVESTMPDLRNPRKMVRDMGRGYLDTIDAQSEPVSGDAATAEDVGEDAAQETATESSTEERPKPAVDQREEETADPDEDRESA
jgi:Sec-independent protein translocase protein TatA